MAIRETTGQAGAHGDHPGGGGSRLRYRQLYEDGIEMPEDSYHGEDIIQHAKNFAALHGDQYMSVSEEERQKALVAYALPLNVEKIKNDLEKCFPFGITKFFIFACHSGDSQPS